MAIEIVLAADDTSPA